MWIRLCDYTPETIVQDKQKIIVKFKITAYIDEELSETSYEKYNFIYNASRKIRNDKKRPDSGEYWTGTYQEIFAEVIFLYKSAQSQVIEVDFNTEPKKPENTRSPAMVGPSPKTQKKDKEKTSCASGFKYCICIDKFTVEDGFIKHSRIVKNHVSAIEHGNFKDPKKSIQKVILHRTAGGTTQACINAFKGGRKNKKGGIDHYGTHFVVGKDGIITQTANLTKVTWHCAGWNSKSVGIEVVGFAIDEDGKPTLGLKGQNPVAGWENLTEVQAKSVACLVKALLNYFNLDKSKIDCHEHLAPKEAGEGQIVYNAIKDYL